MSRPEPPSGSKAGVGPAFDVTQLAKQTPEWLQPHLKRVATNPTLNRGLRRPRWGNLRRDRPFSTRTGDRGTPIDRAYSDAFVSEHRAAIGGSVLEIGSDRCATTFGHQVGRVEIMDIATDNLRATLVADIGEAGSLQPATYDCAIAAHVLQFLAEPGVALANLWQSLRPGGCLLVTVPALGRCDPYASGTESWRFLEPGLRHLATESLRPAPAELTLRTYGNLRTSLAALAGIAAEELTVAELDRVDGEYPVVIGLAATRPAPALS